MVIRVRTTEIQFHLAKRHLVVVLNPKHVLKVEAAGATTVDETLAMPPVHPDQGSSSGSSVPAIEGEFDGQNVVNVHHNSPIKELTTNSLDEERHETPEPSMRGPARNTEASDVRRNLPPSGTFKLPGCKMDPIPRTAVPAAPRTEIPPVPRTTPAASGSRQIALPSTSGPSHGSQQVSPKSHGVECRPKAADPKPLAGLAPASTPTNSPQNSARAHGPRPGSSASSDPGARVPVPPPSAGSSTAAATAAPPVTALAPSQLQLNLLPNPSIPKPQAEHVPTGEPQSHRSVNALHTQLDPTRVNTGTARASVPIRRLPEVPSSLRTRPQYEDFLRYHLPKRYTFNDLAEDVYKARASPPQDAPPAGESSRAASSTTGISASGTPSDLHTSVSGETSASLSSGVAAHLSDLDLPPTLAVGISDDLSTFGSTGHMLSL
ncbi:hypothetical protein PHLGIDRAFT_460937 [Phlebiopsis gigantea 11061_1 CR5-6]|uniref:Uncharacterized protein n=1 Tax=Phlebiopsis gigantea (strain 11061_1 CR5-6) TaxID=745531 RepID=A0A0C3S6W3_PHLG1|nr:hypothetical protein PHLGIDRAFT_460937 [Phlebiopsis gigantea 11061_1 CR5-6]